MPSYPPRGLGSRFQLLLQSFAQHPEPHGTGALSVERLERLCQEEEVDFGQGPHDIYTPELTLWALVTQVLSASKSCVAAVARVLALAAALSRPLPSANTGAYCKARAKLPEALLRRLTVRVGTELEDRVPASWRWKQRHRTLLVDGATVTLADTPANQQAYPQVKSQKPGLGFPILRLVVLLGFATAGVRDAALGPYQGKESGETALFRQLLAALRADDVVVADRYYCSYWLVALVLQRGAQVVFRLHHLRHYDFNLGQRLGAGDHVTTWTKPARPSWMDAETYAAFPDTLTIRELQIQVTQPGFRTRQVVIATTLLDATEYRKEELGDLYHQRWQAELDLRSLKQTLRMDHILCKTPAMARRELWAHLLGYNLVRQALAEAAWQANLSPRQLSFAGGMQTLEAFRMPLLACAAGSAAWTALTRPVFIALAAHRVGNRPNRVEPRKVKRRPKSYGRLTKPREQARQELLAETAA